MKIAYVMEGDSIPWETFVLDAVRQSMRHRRSSPAVDLDAPQEVFTVQSDTDMGAYSDGMSSFSMISEKTRS